MTFDPQRRRLTVSVACFIGWSIAFLALAAATHVGAIVLLIAVAVWRAVERRFRPTAAVARMALRGSVFVALYAAGTAVVVPPLAAAAGRTALPCDIWQRRALAPSTIWTCILNRHYVAADVDRNLRRIADTLSRRDPGLRTGYLDAGFPFLDGFPMIPHLSHREGRDVDLSFQYADAATGAARPAPSPVGYWGYVQPRPGDPQPCRETASWFRWRMDWLQPLLGGGRLDESATALLIKTLAESPDVARIFLEPHLKVRLDLHHPKIRFQGCRAARHDDHLHVEFAGARAADRIDR